MRNFLFGLMVILGIGAVDPLPLSMAVSPIFQFAPGTVLYKLHFNPHRDNVQFCLGYTNITFGGLRSSCQQLNGMYSPMAFWQEYTKLPPGEYEGFAELYRAPRYLTSRVTQSFRVLEQH